MIIFGSTLSPFVRKTAAFLREKGLEFDLQPTGIPNPSPEFCAASPFRKMPAFQDNDYCLADSSAICHYGCLVGDRLTLADIAVASPFVNLSHLSIELDQARHPKTVAYVQRILSRPSFAPLVEKEIAFLEKTAPQPQPA